MKEIPLNNDFDSDCTVRERIERMVDLMNAAGQGVPLLGILVNYENNREIRRMLELLLELNKRVDDLNEKEKFYVKAATKDGEILLNYGLLKSGVCHRDEQIKTMADIIIATLGKNKISESDAEVLIDIVSGLNNTEFKFFYEVYNVLHERYKDHPIKLSNVYSWEIKKDSLVPEEYGGMFDRFIAKGLFSEEVVTPDKSINKMFDTERKCKYTYYGRLFLIVIYGFTEINFEPKYKYEEKN